MSYRDRFLWNKISEQMNLDCEFGWLDGNVGLACAAFDTGSSITHESIWLAIGAAETGFAQNRGWLHAFENVQKEFPGIAGVRGNELLLKDAFEEKYPGREMSWTELREIITRPATDPKYAFFWAEPGHQLTTNENYDQRLRQTRAEQQAEQNRRANLTRDAETDAKIILAMTAGIDLPQAQDRRTAELQALSRPELRQRWANVQESKRLKALPVEDLRKIVRAEDKARNDAFRTFPPLPDLYYPPDSTVGQEWNWRLIKSLKPDEMRRINRIYGSEQFNRKINEVNQNRQ